MTGLGGVRAHRRFGGARALRTRTRRLVQELDALDAGSAHPHLRRAEFVAGAVVHQLRFHMVVLLPSIEAHHAQSARGPKLRGGDTKMTAMLLGMFRHREWG